MKPFRSEAEFGEKWREIGLTGSARTRIEKELKEYASFHAVKGPESGTVRVEDVGRSIERIPQSGILSFIQLSNWNLKPMTALILIALLAGGTTSFAAERAVPGDALYGVKVEVNEEVKSFFAFGNDDEAELQARLMEERLEEAETLASRGELTSEAAADLGLRMKAHMGEAEDRSETAEVDGDFETAASVRASVDASLRSYATILASMNGTSGNTGVVNLLTELNAMTTAHSNVDTRTSFSASADADVEEKVEGTFNAAVSFVEKAQAEFNDAKAELSASARATIDARLSKAVEARAQAEASFKAKAYDAAYSASRTAMGIAGEVRTMIDSALRINLDLDTTVDSVLDIGLYNNENTSTNTETSNTETDGEVKIDGEAHSDTSVTTDPINTNLNTNTSVKGSGTIGL